MKRKCVFSMAVIAVLAGMSAVAAADSLPEIPHCGGAEHEKVSKAVAGRDAESKTELYTGRAVSTELPAELPLRSGTDSPELDGEEPYLLAKIAMAEAGTDDTEGKALVMMVVLNRVRDDKFPDSIREVVYQPRQFSPVLDGVFDDVEPDADCWAALDMIMLDGWDESCGATYFESKSESTWHSDNLEFLFRHGRHYFYMERRDGL